MAFARERLTPYERGRWMESSELPKTISGKIRRVELRDQESSRRAATVPSAGGPGTRGFTEFWGG